VSVHICMCLCLEKSFLSARSLLVNDIYFSHKGLSPLQYAMSAGSRRMVALCRLQAKRSFDFFFLNKDPHFDYLAQVCVLIQPKQHLLGALTVFLLQISWISHGESGRNNLVSRGVYFSLSGLSNWWGKKWMAQVSLATLPYLALFLFCLA